MKMNARALLLALALESSAENIRRLATFRRRKTAYVATLLLSPEEYEFFGFVEATDGIDVLWRQTGRPRLTATSY